jgi:Anti-sigma factor NepR
MPGLGNHHSAKGGQAGCTYFEFCFSRRANADSSQPFHSHEGHFFEWQMLSIDGTAPLKPPTSARVASSHMSTRGNAGHSHENDAMQQNNNRDWSREIPSSLNFSQEQVAFFIGHSLRSLYDDVLADDMPEHLKALVHKLEEKYPP